LIGEAAFRLVGVGEETRTLVVCMAIDPAQRRFDLGL